MDTYAFFSDADVGTDNSTFPAATFIDIGELPKGRLFFVDVNSGYGQGNSVELVTEDKAIKSQIANILSTPIGSEPFEPEYGSLLPWRLFEPINQVTSWHIENDTIVAVGRWMGSRITVSRRDCLVRPIFDDPSGNEGYYIMLRYQINATKIVYEWNFSIYR